MPFSKPLPKPLTYYIYNDVLIFTMRNLESRSKRSNFFFQIKKDMAPRSWNLNWFFLKDAGGTALVLLLTFLFRASSCTAVPQETMGKPSRNTPTGLGSALLLLQCYVSLQGTPVILLYHRKCYVYFHGTQVVLLYHRKCYVSFHGAHVVLLYHRKRWENQAGLGLRT